MLSATSRPTARGRRCVPPAPGRRPSFTSGSATCAPGAGDPVVAGQRQLEAAAHGHAVDGGDDRLRRGLHGLDDGVQRGLGRHLGRPELADVGAAGEALSGADEHDRHDAGIGGGAVEALDEPAPQLVAEAVDGRVVRA